MATFREFLAAIGVGAARVEIELDQKEHPRGAVCTGTVVLRGGTVRQVVEALDLTHYRTNSADAKWGPLQIKLITLHAEVGPGSVHSYPFEFEVPPHAMLGSDGTLTVTVRIANSADPSASVRLNVVKHREIDAIQAALHHAGFRVYAPARLIEKAVEVPAELYHYRPPEELRDLVEEVMVTIWPDSTQTLVELVFRARGTGLQGWLHGLSVASRMRYIVEMDNRELVGTTGILRPLGFVPHLRTIVDELLRAGHPDSRLLRPSAAPDVETLLRPTTGADAVRPDELLRPADVKESEW